MQYNTGVRCKETFWSPCIIPVYYAKEALTAASNTLHKYKVIAATLLYEVVKSSIHALLHGISSCDFHTYHCHRVTTQLQLINIIIREYIWKIFRHYRSFFTKWPKATISFVTLLRLSVCPHGTTRLWPDRLALNLIFQFSIRKYAEKI